MHEPTYRDALRTSWQLAWHHKSLWFFGLFAALLGQMGIVELFSKVGFAGMKYQNPSGLLYVWELIRGLTSKDLLSEIHFSPEQWIWFVWLIIIFIGLGVVLLFVSVVSQGAIVHSTARFVESKGKKFEHSSNSWHESRIHFWKLLGLNVIRKLIMIAFVSFVIWGLYNVIIEPRPIDSVLFIFLFILTVAMGIVLSFLLIYAVGYVVVERYGFIESIRAAWRMFTDHWFVSLEIGFMLLLANIVFVILLLVGMYILFLPSLVMWTAAILTQNTGLYTLGIVLGFTFFLTYVALIGSVFQVFTTATWTYLFTKMHRHGLASRVFHWFGFRK